MIPGGHVGQKCGEVKSGPPSDGRQDGWRGVRGQQQGVVQLPDRGAQVTLVRRDAGVNRGWDERGGSGKRDEERLGTRPTLRFGLSIVVCARIILSVLDTKE